MNHFESEAVSTPETRKAALWVLLGKYFYNTEGLRLRAQGDLELSDGKEEG